MKWFSRLLMKVASWLSPQTAETFSPTMPSEIHQLQRQLETLSGHLYSQSSMDLNSTPNSDTIHQLEQALMEEELKEAKARTESAEAQRTYSQMLNLPHRTYVPMLSHDGLQWVAIAEFASGDKLVGRGDCPNAALMDFSNQWLGIKGL